MKRKKPACAIPDCWEDAKVSGLCVPCYCWWLRMQLKTPDELSLYLKRAARTSSRIGSQFLRRRRAA